MYKSKLEKSIDARNEGFDAKDAFNEQAFEPRKSIIKKTKKKEGLKEYSEKEVANRSGSVKHVDLYGPCTWKEFRSYDRELQIKYIYGLLKQYPDINSVDLGLMFDRKSGTVSAYLNELGIHIRRGGTSLTPSRLNFRNKYVVTINEEEKVQETDILLIKFVSAVSDVENMIKKYGFDGRVKIIVEKV